jgi:DNA-binding SARP family transcriptional activator
VGDAEVRVKLFGVFRASQGGREIVLPGRGARIIAYLALVSERRADRELVAVTLWPDVTRSRSMANLRASLWRLPDEVRALIMCRGNCISLSRNVRVDVDLLAPTADSEPSVDQISNTLLSSWYDEWVVVERERIELRRLAALEQIARRHLDERRWAEAIDVALLAIAADPYRESLHRVVLESHVAEGNHSEARTHYERLRATLETEIGALPAEATRATIAGIDAAVV